MVEIKAEAKGKGVDVSTEFDGTSIDLIAEGVAAVDALYDGLRKNGLHKLFIAGLLATVKDWIDEVEGGENLA